MKLNPFHLLLFLPLMFTSCLNHHDFRQEKDLDQNWKFHPGDAEGAEVAGFDDSGWRVLDLPHDFSIESVVKEDNPSGTAGGYFKGGIGWYRKVLDIPRDYAGKTIYLLFDGIYENGEIWVNGKKAGQRSYGYESSYYDITSLVTTGRKNLLAVRVENSGMPVDRWYSGSGIYRDVSLLAVNPVHIGPWGTYIRNLSFSPGKVEMIMTSSLQNHTGQKQSIKIISHIYNPGGQKVMVVNSGVLETGIKSQIDQVFTIDRPDLWSPEHPALYEAVTDILTPDNTILDTYITRFGVRDAEFLPDSGFVLNGKKLMMKGVCLHHDLGCLGSAYYPEVMKSRLRTLKDCGVNAIRLSHNPYAPDVLQMCDEMGFVVIDEMYDKWETEWGGYHGTRAPFMQTFRKDLGDFIMRDRNHPSVVLWSVGNETTEQLDNPDRGVEILQLLMDQVSMFDTTREITCALHPGGEFPSRYIDHLNVVAYNYRVEQFKTLKQTFPGKVFLGSETKVYQEGRVDDYHNLDFSKNTWFMLSPADAGQFIWAGIDYLGESRGWPDKGIRTGFINTCGEVKPYGYFTKSLYADKPFVQLTVLDASLADSMNNFRSWQKIWYGPPLVSHWNFETSSPDSLQVVVFTNAPETEIILNGRSLGKRMKADYPGGVIILPVRYSAGTLTARAYKNNKVVAESSLQTAGKPARLKVVTQEPVSPDGRQKVIMCDITVTDAEGVTCPTDRYRVNLQTEGPANFLGADNGDMADHTLYSMPEREVRDGKCLFIVKKTGKPGRIKLHFSAQGLPDKIITL